MAHESAQTFAAEPFLKAVDLVAIVMWLNCRHALANRGAARRAGGQRPPEAARLQKPSNDASRWALVDDIIYTITLTTSRATQPKAAASLQAVD